MLSVSMPSYQSVCVYWKWPERIARYQVWVVLFSAFLIHFSLGISYVFSNMVPYVISYIRVYSSPSDIQIVDATYITAAHISGHAVTVSFGGLIEKKLGPRLAAIIGILLVDLGILLSYWTVQKSFWLFLVTYGLLAGIGGGLAYIAPITCVMKWVPKWRGLATGVIVGGFGLSTVMFDVVQTGFINPLNLKPNFIPEPDEKYFTQPELLTKVPQIFLIQLSVAVVLQIIGCTFIVNPTSVDPSPQVTHEQSEFYKYGLQSNKVVIKTIESSADQSHDVTPLQALTKKNLYMIWSMFFCSGITSSFVVTLYKAFGLDLVVSDDHFLTELGITASVMGFVGRILWGLYGDITSYKTAIVCQSAISTIILLTLYTTTVAGKWMYFVWICTYYYTFGGNYSLFPSAVAKSFGQTHMGIIYGFVFTSHAVSSIIAAFVTSELIEVIGWDGILFVLSALSGLEFCLVLYYQHITYTSNTILTQQKI